jgi:coenzyme PQQ biosynthesis protein C
LRLTNYDFVGEETLAYFTARPPQAQRDSNFALAYVLEQAQTHDQQQGVIAALEFKCDVLWAQLDGLWLAYVDHQLPPGAWNPEEKK